MSTITTVRHGYKIRAIESTDELQQMFIDSCKALGLVVIYSKEAINPLQCQGLDADTAVTVLDLLKEEGFSPVIGQAVDGLDWVVAI
jgi:hypothetical protein